MIIRYGLYYLIIAWILLLLLLYHFMNQRRVEDMNSRIFEFFIIIGLLDILFDMVSTILMSGDFPHLAETAKFTLTVFYMMQVAMPCAMMCYAFSLREITKEQLRKKMIVSILFAGMMMLFVFLNYIKGYIFYFDSEGNYYRGPLYLSTYIYAVIYGLSVLLGALTHLSQLTREKMRVIREFLIIEFVSVLVQATTGALTTGLGIAIGILVLFLTINNPNSYTDNLTNLFDKKYFSIWMKQRVEQGNVVHLFGIELGTLGQVNKTYGTSVGNQLLLQVAEHLQGISSTENVFRTSGNQFLIVSGTLAEYERQKEDLRQYFDKIFYVEKETITFPAIICGIQNASEIYKADSLEAYIDYMIASVPKSSETILVQASEKSMEGFRYEQEIERFLGEAIEKDLFEVNYQPIYSMETASFVTLEALSRLKHPYLGPVSPEVFIGIAERSGQIADIGELQLKRICRFVKENPELQSVVKSIKVNLSPAELLKEGHTQVLIDIIRASGVKTAFFQFEITETIATEYSERLYKVASEFRSSGIELCLDDFGAGYANLNAILKLPFYAVKLDRSLLNGITDNCQISLFYKSIVSVLKNLGYKIVAEGVETEEEVILLRDWGVDYIQGYYYSKPLNEKETLIKLGMTGE